MSFLLPVFPVPADPWRWDNIDPLNTQKLLGGSLHLFRASLVFSDAKSHGPQLSQISVLLR